MDDDWHGGTYGDRLGTALGQSGRMELRNPTDQSQDPGKESSISPEERRLNRLVFWSVTLLDFALAFGVGRPTTFRIEDVTQPLPTQENIWPNGIPQGMPRSPFPLPPSK